MLIRHSQEPAAPLAAIPLEVFATGRTWAALPEAIKVAVIHVWRAERKARVTAALGGRAGG